jgi:hypothetical protein
VISRVEVMSMEFYERLSMRPLLWAHLHDLTGTRFQEFFQELMVMCSPGFVDVRTHGNIGDLASDGLDLCNRKLYACYAPEVPKARTTVGKFETDLTGAIQSHRGDPETFRSI